MIRLAMFLDLHAIAPGVRRELFDAVDGWEIAAMPDGRVRLRHADFNGGHALLVKGDHTLFEAPDPEPPPPPPEGLISEEALGDTEVSAEKLLAATPWRDLPKNKGRKR